MVHQDYIVQRMFLSLPDLTHGWDAMNWRVKLVRSQATDRITLRYTIGSVAEIYGRIYFDRTVGRATHRHLMHLWEHGFAAGSGLEIPEPLAFIEDANLLLIRRAQGTPLSKLVATSSIQAALAAVQGAAKWLAKYHTTEIPALSAQSPCERVQIFEIANELARIACEHPELSSLLISMLRDLEVLAPKGNLVVPAAPLHGCFCPAHVFADDDRVSVIGIEQARLSDPAKDVANFVHLLTKSYSDQIGDTQRAAQLAREFVSEYLTLAPLNLENARYYRALLTLKELTKRLKTDRMSDVDQQIVIETYRAELQRATHGDLLHTIAA